MTELEILKENYGISERAFDYVNSAEKDIREYYKGFEKTCAYNN